MQTTHNSSTKSSSNENKEDALQEEKLHSYTNLLKQKNWKLAFPNTLEKQYQHDIKKDFIETNRFTVCFGVLFYTSFLLIDYLFYEDLKAEVLISRVVISCIAAMLLSAIFFKESVKHVLSTTLFCAILMGWQIVSSAIFYFEQPYNLLYAIGVLPIIVFGILVFRFSFKHTFILVLFLFGGYLVHVISAYPYQPDAGMLQDVLNVASPIMVVFMAAICTMGLYMSYAVDRLNRSDWLKNLIMQIESEKLSTLTKKLETLSATDGLTGLYNRRYFDEELRKHWQISREKQLPLSVMMLDLDWFKLYNDYYGHQQGDACLQHISNVFTNVCKPHHAIVSRYGGEEFIIILPYMEAYDAQTLANNICSRVFFEKITHEASPLKFCSVSVGVHTVRPSQTEANNAIGKFLKEVDIALYQAKRNGKNQVSSDVHSDISS